MVWHADEGWKWSVAASVIVIFDQVSYISLRMSVFVGIDFVTLHRSAAFSKPLSPTLLSLPFPSLDAPVWRYPT